jgi:CRP/FNR family transcriptional regulator
MSNAPHLSFRTWRRGEFYDSLQIEELGELERFTSFKSIQPGFSLFSEQGLPSNVFIVLNGRVKLSVNSINGKRFILRIAEPGEVLGIESAMTGNPYEMTAIASSLCHIASIQREEFLRFLERHPSALKSAARLLSNHYDQACARFRIIGGSPSIFTKLARFLLESSPPGGRSEAGMALPLTLTQEEIGECVGMCRESVSRVLGDFQRRKFIAVHGSRLLITDRNSLERYAAN